MILSLSSQSCCFHHCWDLIDLTFGPFGPFRSFITQERDVFLGPNERQSSSWRFGESSSIQIQDSKVLLSHGGEICFTVAVKNTTNTIKHEVHKRRTLEYKSHKTWVKTNKVQIKNCLREIIWLASFSIIFFFILTVVNEGSWTSLWLLMMFYLWSKTEVSSFGWQILALTNTYNVLDDWDSQSEIKKVLLFNLHVEYSSSFSGRRSYRAYPFITYHIHSTCVLTTVQSTPLTFWGFFFFFFPFLSGSQWFHSSQFVMKWILERLKTELAGVRQSITAYITSALIIVKHY